MKTPPKKSDSLNGSWSEPLQKSITPAKIETEKEGKREWGYRDTKEGKEKEQIKLKTEIECVREVEVDKEGCQFVVCSGKNPTG